MVRILSALLMVATLMVSSVWAQDNNISVVFEKGKDGGEGGIIGFIDTPIINEFAALMGPWVFSGNDSEATFTKKYAFGKITNLDELGDNTIIASGIDLEDDHEVFVMKIRDLYAEKSLINLPYKFSMTDTYEAVGDGNIMCITYLFSVVGQGYLQGNLVFQERDQSECQLQLGRKSGYGFIGQRVERPN